MQKFMNIGSQKRPSEVSNVKESAPLRRSETIRENVDAEVVEVLNQSFQRVSTNKLPVVEESMGVDEAEITLQTEYMLIVEDFKDDLGENAVEVFESYDDGDAIEYHNYFVKRIKEYGKYGKSTIYGSPAVKDLGSLHVLFDKSSTLTQLASDKRRTSANIPYCETDYNCRFKLKLIADTELDEQFEKFRSCRRIRTTAARLNEDKEFIGKRFWEESVLDNSAKCSHIYPASDIEREAKYTGVSAPSEEQKNEGHVTRF
uniref:Protein FAR1-RELATED SEQUENCE n=1 Tax=Rhabditophanes sp. KR3021 TaxID=114890 RepID=A0AC35U7Y4_9BILA